MNNKIKFISIFIIFISLFLNLNLCIEIITSSIVKKDVNVLGVDLSYALIDIEFDQDIYKYDSLGCPNFECTPPSSTIIDCSCDYTDVNECPKVRDSSCTDPCPMESSDGIELCNSDQDMEWTTIEFDKQYIFNTTNYKMKRFRIKADGLGCKGVFLKVVPLQGYGDTYMGYTPSLTYQRYSSEFKPQRIALFNICPSDNWDTTLYYTYTESWTRDTYFINVSPQTPFFQFSLILHSNNVPSEPIDTSNCIPATPDHTCITTGEIIHGLTSYDPITFEIIPSYYSFQVTTPGFYYFNFPCMYQNVIYYMSNSSIKPSNFDSLWELSEDYDNYIVLYLEISTIYISALTTYDTNFTFSITNQGDKYKTSFIENESMTVQGGAMSLVNSARLNLPNNVFIDNPTYVDGYIYSILYPQIDISPLWPVPITFINQQRFNFFLISQKQSSYNSFKPKSFQVAIILSSSIGKDNLIKNFDFQLILNSKLQFLSNLFDENDNPLNFEIEFKEKEIECNNENFEKILKLIQETEDLLFGVSDMDELNNYRYSLDSLTMSNAWIGCSNKASNLLEIEEISKNISIRYCPFKEDDPEYLDNPCCSINKSYYECCNPSMYPSTINQFIKVNNDLVIDQCSSPDCTSSVLLDYGNSLSSIDDCAVPDNEPTKLELSATTVLRQCKSVLDAPICNNDQDCRGYGTGQCNLYSRTCLPDFNSIDREYVKCVLTNLATGTLFSLLGGSTNVNDSVIDSVFQNHIQNDCTGYQNIQDRSTYTWGSRVEYSKTDCYSAHNCLDATCLTHHDTCLDRLYAYWDFRIDSHLDSCSDWGTCPFLECQDNTASVNGIEKSCKEACDEVALDFCGYCTNDVTQCHVIDGVKNITDCQNQQNLCLLPNGEYDLTSTSEQDCNSKGHCTVPCGYECISSFANSEDDICVIISTEMDTETKCASLNNATNPNVSQWSNETQICIYNLATTSQDCLAMNEIQGNTGYSWIDCSSKTNNGECAGAVGRVDLCQLSTIECQSESECLQVGSCTDQYYFNPITSNNANYNFGQGKCLFPHGSYHSYISCETYVQNDSPNGCFATIPTVINQIDCEETGGVWWVPATNQNQCTSQMGCKILEDPGDVNNLPYNYNFNEMTQDLCEGCMDSFNQWTNKFEWTNAKWIPGIYKPTQWLTGKSFIPNVIVDVFNYQLFYNSVIKAAKTQVADLFRSEAYCRMERLQSNLNSITCSCSGEGGSKCFAQSTPLLGQTKPCAGASSTFTFDYGRVEFSNNSIDQSCQTLSVSQISREIYTSTQEVSLASNFVSYQKPDNYGVLNSNGAIVGTLLSDGIMIKSQDGIKAATICLLIFNQNQLDHSKYSILDFAIQRDNESKPIPLEIETFKQVDNDTTNDIYLCSLIANIPNGNPIYFPINRFNQWKDESKQAFDSTSRALMYTLAALFLAVTLWGLFEICIIIHSKFNATSKKNFQLTHLLICVVTLFILIRTVYFFIMPSGHLSDSPVSDYILVVLPTFIYFTAFNILLVLWYVIVFLVLKKNKSADNLSKRLFKIVFTINTCLYLLFIAIVLVFQYTKSTPTNDCGSRMMVSIKSSTPQRVVSIVYAVIQAVISLIMGAAFLYLGGRLFVIMRNTNIKVGSRSNHQRKVFTLTMACSIGFILHCVFVLILVAGNVNSMIFSFIGLVITEIIPAISILYCFEQQMAKSIKSTSSEGSKGKTNSNNSNSNNSNNSGGGNRISTSISTNKMTTFNNTSGDSNAQSKSDFDIGIEVDTTTTTINPNSDEYFNQSI